MNIGRAIEVLMDIQSNWEDGEEYEAFNLALQTLEDRKNLSDSLKEPIEKFIEFSKLIGELEELRSKNGLIVSDRELEAQKELIKIKYPREKEVTTDEN